jgi:hypothetical protein
MTQAKQFSSSVTWPAVQSRLVFHLVAGELFLYALIGGGK